MSWSSWVFGCPWDLLEIHTIMSWLSRLTVRIRLSLYVAGSLNLEVPRFLFLGLCLNFHYFSTGVVFPKLGFDFSRRAVAQALVEP